MTSSGTLIGGRGYLTDACVYSGHINDSQVASNTDILWNGLRDEA